MESDLKILRESLFYYGYSEKAFHRRGINPFRRALEEYPPLAFQLNKPTPQSILLSLFFLGSELTLSHVEKAFGPNWINRLMKINVLEKNENKIKSKIMILPYKNYYFASDFLLRCEGDSYTRRINKNYKAVYPISLDSTNLCEAMVNYKINSTLDLCTGSGILAIYASSFSKNVTGVDINSRAINFASFNARLNKVKNVKFLQGNLYEPVYLQKFDLIIANPPFGAFPDRTYLFSYGGKNGYHVLKQIINGLPYHLKKHGYCQIVTNFYNLSNLSKREIIKKWLSTKSPYRILFLELFRMSCVQQVLFSNNYLLIDFKKYEQETTRLLAYLQKMKVKDISYGILTLRQATRFQFVDKQLIKSIDIPNNSRNTIISYYSGVP